MSLWYIGNPNTGAGYKDHGPFDSEEDAMIYAGESGLDRESDRYEIWEDDEGCVINHD